MDVVAGRTSDSASGSPSQPSGGSAVSWRQIGRHLWVGRCDGMPVGLIEEGRRFTFIDAEDRPHRGFATLEAAQTAAGPDRVVPGGATPAPAVETRGPRPLRLPTASIVWLTASLLAGGAAIALLRFGSTVFLLP